MLKIYPRRLIDYRFQMSTWTSTVGLEIHAQILTASKLFSFGKVDFDAPANASVNIFDAGIPGTLPMLNTECVKLAVTSSLALSCSINPVSYFDRKHYFYADLPFGYQITQKYTPIAENGHLDFHVYTPGVHKHPYRKSCRLRQVQIEQDSGKSLHDKLARSSYIDLNRAGVGLMEFVFEPDLQDGEEAAALVKELILILERLGSCSCKMEEGALRVDANVSISNEPGKLGVRTEIKNIGSVRGVANAVKFEIHRQKLLVKNGITVVNETRGWDPNKKETVVVRETKEGHDYRFMPEPNLPPLCVCIDPKSEIVAPGVLDLKNVKSSIPVLPETSRLHLMKTYGFIDVYAIMLVNQPCLYNYFNTIMNENPKRNAKLVWNVLMVQLLNVLNNNGIEVDSCLINSGLLGELVDLLHSGVIDFQTGREILGLVLHGSMCSAQELVDANNWKLVSDPDVIENICHEIILRNPKAVKKYKKGKQRALQTLIDDVTNLTTEKINLSMVSQKLKEILCNE